jgi:hypothetical protein
MRRTVAAVAAAAVHRVWRLTLELLSPRGPRGRLRASRPFRRAGLRSVGRSASGNSQLANRGYQRQVCAIISYDGTFLLVELISAGKNSLLRLDADIQQVWVIVFSRGCAPHNLRSHRTTHPWSVLPDGNFRHPSRRVSHARRRWREAAPPAAPRRLCGHTASELAHGRNLCPAGFAAVVPCGEGRSCTRLLVSGARSSATLRAAR